MKTIKKILFFISLFFLYLIVKEFLLLYHYASSLHAAAGYGVLALIALFMGYFVFLPIFRIISMPVRLYPTRNPQNIDRFIQTRMKFFRKNSYLIRTDFNFESVHDDLDGYKKIINYLKPEMKRIRKRYVTKVFYSTAIAQNGFLDAILIISSSVNMVKELFILYHGRVSNRDLFRIAKMVYWSMIIGGSEGVEYAVDEIISKLFSESIKGIAFASRILGSIADGLVNSALLTRLSLITENYCTKIFIKSRKDLYPNYKTVVSLTQIITSDILKRISKEIKSITKNKSKQFIAMTVNPVKYVIEKAFKKESKKSSSEKEDMKNEIFEVSPNPLSYLMNKLIGIFRRR